MSLLEARSITLTARLGEATVDVLRDISFTLERGETLGLVGESGAGKSMIGRLCSQLLPPGFAVSAGELHFEGTDLVRLGAHRRRALLGKRIAFVPQEPMTALNPVLSVASQIDEHLRRLGVGGRATRRRHAIGMLSAVHLPEPEKLLAKYPHELSGGMCQRVLIAMAFAGDPALVIADEPTTALDVITQARIMALIKEMQAMHRTAVVLITHDLRLAAHVCDTVLVMYAGDVVERGDAKTLLQEPKHPYTRSLRRANPNLSGPRRRLPTLPDHMPGLAEFGGLPGCRFAPRCPVRAEACERAVPALVALTPGAPRALCRGLRVRRRRGRRIRALRRPRRRPLMARRRRWSRWTTSRGASPRGQRGSAPPMWSTRCATWILRSGRASSSASSVKAAAAKRRSHA